MAKSVMIVTTGRADYWLLRPLLAWMAERDGLDVQLVATGAHLSERHGATIRIVEQDSPVGVAATVDMVPEDDTADGLCRSLARGVAGFAQIYTARPPDLLVVLGDRYELWAACQPAVIHQIPIAHIHGGEITAGAIDDAVRHSITKMAVLHFAAHEVYAGRIVQMGEDPRRVFVVGALGLDAIRSTPLLSRDVLGERTGVDFSRPVALMTYHPVTLDAYDAAARQVTEVVEALLATDLTVLATMPNTDTGSGQVYEVIRSYAGRFPGRIRLVKNLGSQAYLSAMRYARVMVGNSSSGILESASFQLPVVNVGDRQAGRVRPCNVIDCPCDRRAIGRALARALSEEFRDSLVGLVSPYGDGRAAMRIGRIIEETLQRGMDGMLKKGFYDLASPIPAVSQEATEPS